MGDSSRALRGALLLAASGSVAPEAFASAWSLPEGVEQWFATISREAGDFGQAWRTDDYNEMGLGEGWGVNFKVESQIRIADTYDDRSGFRAGLQKAFAIGDRASFSVQASVLGGESLDGPECVGTGFEARAAIGTSFSLWDREGYVNIEAGQRNRGSCERSVAEFATGLEFAPEWLLEVKAWREGGAETGSAKAEFVVARDLDIFTLGIGWREEISGNFEESGWIVSARGHF
jgi:hypothetical protein